MTERVGAVLRPSDRAGDAARWVLGCRLVLAGGWVRLYRRSRLVFEAEARALHPAEVTDAQVPLGWPHRDVVLTGEGGEPVAVLQLGGWLPGIRHLKGASPDRRAAVSAWVSRVPAGIARDGGLSWHPNRPRPVPPGLVRLSVESTLRMRSRTLGMLALVGAMATTFVVGLMEGSVASVTTGGVLAVVVVAVEARPRPLSRRPRPSAVWRVPGRGRGSVSLVEDGGRFLLVGGSDRDQAFLPLSGPTAVRHAVVAGPEGSALLFLVAPGVMVGSVDWRTWSTTDRERLLEYLASAGVRQEDPDPSFDVSGVLAPTQITGGTGDVPAYTGLGSGMMLLVGAAYAAAAVPEDALMASAPYLLASVLGLVYGLIAVVDRRRARARARVAAR